MAKNKININITVGYDNEYFYVYNNGKQIKRITLEQVSYLLNKL